MEVIIDLWGIIDETVYVNDVDMMVQPRAYFENQGYGHLTILILILLLLLLHPFHVGPPFFWPTGIVKNVIGGGKLSKIDVGHDINVPIHFKEYCPLFSLGWFLLMILWIYMNNIPLLIKCYTNAQICWFLGGLLE